MHIVAIENSKNIYPLVSKILTLMDIANLILRDLSLPDMLTVNQFGTMEEDSMEILPEELLSDIGDEETIEEYVMSKATEAIISSTVESLKDYNIADASESLFSHGINEILLLHLRISNTQENLEAKQIISELKDEIIAIYKDILNDYTNEIIQQDIINKFKFIRFYDLKANCVLLNCNNDHGLKIKEER